MRALLLAALVALALGSPAPERQKRALHGKRVYLRAWSEEEALNFNTQDGPSMMERQWQEPELTPEVMPLSIHSEEGDHVHGLLLQRNTRIEHPVTVAFGDEQEHISLVAEGEAHYQDSMSNAIFGMRQVNGQRHFDGSFHLDGDHYELHPMEETDGVVARGFESYHPHMITQAPVHTYAEPLETDEGDILASTTEEKRSGEKHVEMAIVVDYSEYLRWYTAEGDSEEKAKTALLYKFAYTYNGMDKIYDSVSDVTVWIKKLDIQTDKSKSAVLELYRNMEPSQARLAIIDADAILPHEMTWGPKNEYAVPKNFDHVMYWVGYQISSGGSTATIGLAYVGGVCGSYGYSLVEDTGFESYRTAAHELGHNLGANHDADASGECSADKHHIMAATEGMPDADHNADGWKFSKCSTDAFDTTLSTKTCLGNEGSHDNDLGKPSVVNPGEKYNANWQCAWTNMNVKGTTHCFGGTTRPSECYQGMFCTVGGGKCSASSSLRPADGTPCQGGKCQGGKCV